MAKRVGVVLSGCGVFDGSEIHEAVAILTALDKRGAQIICCAPDLPLAAINHLTRSPEAHPRDVLAESARIARGKIQSLGSVSDKQLEAVILPGGFGAAKNLCTFAAEGPACNVNPQLSTLLLAMHAAGKPIGMACIAPVIAAAVFGPRGIACELTIGTDAETAAAITKMGCSHRNTQPADVCVDRKNRLVTTPCYMTATGPWQVFQGADRLVEEVLAMA